MKTTVELPDALFREAKTRAAAEGITFKDLLRDAVETRLGKNRKTAGRPFMKLAGSLKHLHDENVKIARFIEEEFGNVEEGDWR